MESGKARRSTATRAVVLGAGPVGLLGAMALVAGGFDTYVYSRDAAPKPEGATARSRDRRALRRRPTARVASSSLAERVGNIDVVYEATGASTRRLRGACRSLGTNGVFVFTGVPGRKGRSRSIPTCIMRNLVLKNQVVFGTVNAGRDAFEAAIRDLAYLQAALAGSGARR